MDCKDLKLCLPKHSLSTLNAIFLSFYNAVLKTKAGIAGLPDVKLGNNIPNMYNYDYDHHTYLADCNVFEHNGDTKLLCIKLASNGFLFPQEEDLKDVMIATSRLVKLDPSLMVKDFPDVLKFAKSYLRSTVKVQLFYSFNDCKMTFRALSTQDATFGVVITFESLVPVDGQFDDDDYWLYEDETVS